MKRLSTRVLGFVAASALAAVPLCVSSHAGHAATVTSMIGQEGTVGDGTNSLTAIIASDADGWISGNLSWTHNFSFSGTINSATLEVDFADLDGGTMGLTGDGFSLGSFTGGSTGGPGPWQPSTGSGVVNLVINLTGSALTALFDGSFTVAATPNGSVSIWGTNRSILTVDYTPSSTIPVPAALPLLASGLGALGFLGWRRKRSAGV